MACEIHLSAFKQQLYFLFFIFCSENKRLLQIPPSSPLIKKTTHRLDKNLKRHIKYCYCFRFDV